MALVLADRVQETTNTTGTGTLTLAGAVAGFQSFSAVGNGNTTYYTITSGNDWEVGIGTYTASGTTLSRNTILASSAAGAAITVAAGAKVFVVYPASKAVALDANGNASVENLFLGYTITVSAATTTALTASSNYFQKISGTTTHTFTLPDATTLPLGAAYVFDNDSTGSVTINDFGATLVDTVTSGAIDYLFLEDNSTSAGVWGKYSWLPAAFNFSSTTADFNGATVVNGSAQYLPSLYYRNDVSRTLSSATGNQSILGASTGAGLTSGVTLLANTVYEVEGEFELSTSGTTSHTESFGFVAAGGLVANRVGIAVNRLSATTTSSALGTFFTSISVSVVTGALTTAQASSYRVKGTIATGAGGQLNPVIAFSAAPGGTIGLNIAWFKFTPIAPATSANNVIGTWA